MHDVRVVPHALRGQRGAVHHHAIGLVVNEPILADEWTLVVAELLDLVHGAGGTAIVGQQAGVERVDPDADGGRCLVGGTGRIAEDVVDDDWLRGDDKDRARRVLAHAESVQGRLTAAAVGVHFERAVGDAHLGLVHLHGVKARERAAQFGYAAAVGDAGKVHAAAAGVAKVQSGPVAFAGLAIALLTDRLECAARTIARIKRGGEDDLAPRNALGNQLSAQPGLDSRPIQLDRDARVDHQAGVQASLQLVLVGQRQTGIGEIRQAHRSAGCALNEQVLGDHVHDVRVVPPAADRLRLQDLARRRHDADKQPVDRVVQQQVAVDIRSHAVVIGREGGRLVKRARGNWFPQNCPAWRTWPRPHSA